MGGKRITIQRTLILNAVKELGNHPTAEQVYEHIIKQYPAIGKSTIYRNLRQMAEAGEVMDIGNFYGATYYDHKDHKHYHCVCKNCKQVFDVEGDFGDISKKVGITEGFDITGCNVNFSGLCWQCKVTYQAQTQAEVV